ncbi:ligand-binding sensor domain-containing protein [Holophaga foetida]|uniref:ligand-binding sensor domain-containing protein n=1 Tax=Holophaga foetida TaxID=35839 RepID=UPI0002FD7A8D|nr:diguanylate cyclase [Holophaga foetida]
MGWVRVVCSWVLALMAGLGGAAAEPEGRFRFRVYGPEQGLKDATINSLEQDSRGFLWIGTETGLLRYDGSQFRKWSHRDGLPESLVLRVVQDQGGGVWAVTAGQGAALFHEGTFRPPMVGGAPLPPGPSSILRGWDGRVWLLRKDGLYLQSERENFQRVVDSPVGKQRAFAASPSRKSILVFCDGTLWEWAQGKGGWAIRAQLTEFPEPFLNGLVEDGAGRLWLVGTRALGYLDGGSTLHMVSGILPAPAYSGGQVKRDELGRVWVPTNNGLLWVRGEEHAVIDQARGLPAKWVNASLVDREGNLWMASASLSRMLDRGYVRTFHEVDGLPSDLVWSLYRDSRGRLWAGTNSGLAWLAPSGWVKVQGTEGMVVYYLAEDGLGRLWIAPADHAPLLLCPGQDSPSVAPLGLKAPIRSLYRDRGGSLWFSPQESGGLGRVSASGDVVISESLPGELHKGKLEVLAFLEDGAGRLWVATNQGLFARENGVWRRWTQQEGLRATALDGLGLAADGAVWVYYTEPSGATKVLLQNGQLRVLEHLDAQGSLPSDLVYALGEDPKGTLWVSTDQGVVRVRQKSSFRLGRGVDRSPDEGNGGAMLVEGNGDVWVGTTRGLIHLLAGNEPVPLPSPLATILQVYWGGQLRREGEHGEVSIPRALSTLEFRFAAATYVDEPSVIYQVRLVGLEDGWRATDVRQARYPSLPAGDYRFEVRAAYPGEAFGPSATFAFHVEQFWWRSWWAIAATVLVIGILVHLWIRWRIRRLAEVKERLEAEVYERTEALRMANASLHEANQALESQSLTDALTGLHNRRFLSLLVEEEAAQVLRVYRESPLGRAIPNRDLVFFMVDLDNFKQVNDRYGHGVGDRILQRTAQVLKKAARESDAVIRMGGEEFLILARNCSRSEAPQVAERLRSLVAQELLHNGDEVIRWTASIGFAAFPFQPSDLDWVSWERATEIADACLYAAKNSGRDAWVGIEARAGLDRAKHGARIPWEMGTLLDEGVLEAVSNHKDPFGRRSGQVFG